MNLISNKEERVVYTDLEEEIWGWDVGGGAAVRMT